MITIALGIILAVFILFNLDVVFQIIGALLMLLIPVALIGGAFLFLTL